MGGQTPAGGPAGQPGLPPPSPTPTPSTSQSRNAAQPLASVIASDHSKIADLARDISPSGLALAGRAAVQAVMYPLHTPDGDVACSAEKDLEDASEAYNQAVQQNNDIIARRHLEGSVSAADSVSGKIAGRPNGQPETTTRPFVGAGATWEGVEDEAYLAAEHQIAEHMPGIPQIQNGTPLQSYLRKTLQAPKWNRAIELRAQKLASAQTGIHHIQEHALDKEQEAVSSRLVQARERLSKAGSNYNNIWNEGVNKRILSTVSQMQEIARGDNNLIQLANSEEQKARDMETVRYHNMEVGIQKAQLAALAPVRTAESKRYEAQAEHYQQLSDRMKYGDPLAKLKAGLEYSKGMKKDGFTYKNNPNLVYGAFKALTGSTIPMDRYEGVIKALETDHNRALSDPIIDKALGGEGLGTALWGLMGRGED